MTATDIDELRAGWDAVGLGVDSDPTPPPPPHTLYKPLSDAIGEYVGWAQNEQDRIYTGIPALDHEMRGTAPGEVTMLTGFSHSGKNVVLTHIFHHNHAKRTLFLCPDEPRTLTLIKLACVAFGRDGRKLEQSVADGDSKVIDLLHQTAEVVYPQFAAIDTALTVDTMNRAWDEVSEVWGAEPQYVAVDFLDLLDGMEATQQRANAVKAFGRKRNVPLIVLHQTSRTAGADGREVTISSGAYGGETQATHIIGVRRRKSELQAQLRELRKKNPTPAVDDQIQEVEYELFQHEHTLTINLVKCKRVGSTLVDEIDFDIAAGSGVLSIRNGQLRSPIVYEQETF